MKKQILLLAGSALILASCGSNTNNQANEQAKMDSITKANAEMQDAMNKQRNDSTINAMAKVKADSIEMANAAAAKNAPHAAGAKTTKTTHTTTTTKETTTPPPAAPAPAPGGMRGHSDQNQTSPQNTGSKQGGGMRAHSDQNTGK